MFLGHVGVALAAKPLAPRASLGTLVFAALWIDLLWPMLLLIGVESVRIEPERPPRRPSCSSITRGHTACSRCSSGPLSSDSCASRRATSPAQS